jgi:hypothetical protein
MLISGKTLTGAIKQRPSDERALQVLMVVLEALELSVEENSS